MTKELKRSTCKNCNQDIYYSDFTESWCHLRTAEASCGIVAEPKDAPQSEPPSDCPDCGHSEACHGDGSGHGCYICGCLH